MKITDEMVYAVRNALSVLLGDDDVRAALEFALADVPELTSEERDVCLVALRKYAMLKEHAARAAAVEREKKKCLHQRHKALAVMHRLQTFPKPEDTLDINRQPGR